MSVLCLLLVALPPSGQLMQVYGFSRFVMITHFCNCPHARKHLILITLFILLYSISSFRANNENEVNDTILCETLKVYNRGQILSYEAALKTATTARLADIEKELLTVKQSDKNFLIFKYGPITPFLHKFLILTYEADRIHTVRD